MNVSIILSALKKHWIWLCIIPVFAAGTIYFVTLKSPQKFKSHAQLATGITESAEVTINENSKDNDQPYKIAQKFNNMMEIMKSRQSINLLQYKILLHELTSSKPFLYPKDVEKFITKENRPKYIKLLQYHSDSMITLNYVVESDVDIQNLINFYGIGMDELLSKISIKRLPESDFILVESETDNAAFSAFIVNCLIQEFIRYYESQKASKSAGSVDFFEKMAKIKKKELDAKVNELKSYKLKNNVINLYEQTKSIVNQLSSVEILREQENAKIPSLTKAINDIELRFTSKEKRYYEAANGKLNNKIDLLKTQLISLNQSYYQNGMTIKFQADSISLIRNQIDQLVQQSADEAIINPNAAKTELISRKLNAEIDLEIAKKTVKSIDEEINRLHGIIKSFAPMEASIGAFEREISVASEVYLLVLNKLNAAQFASLYTGENVRQTEYALPAEKPESSKRMIIVVLTFAISLIIVIAWIIIAKMMDHSIYSKEQLAEILDTDSVIADFPLLNPGELDFKSLFFDSSANYIHQQFAESCRQSRQYILTHVPPHQSILFLSSEQNEGKSFSIISLAYSLTLIGKKVLILDANLKSNSITKLFNPSTFLNNDSNVSGEKFSNNTSSNNDNIAVIGNKLSSGTPKEVFLNNKSKLDFDNMKREFDYIFIEAANTKDYADAKELFDIADALVIIFKSGRPFMKHDIELLKHIATMPNLIKGYILNMVHVEIPNEGFWSNLFRKIFIRKSQKTVQPIYMKFS